MSNCRNRYTPKIIVSEGSPCLLGSLRAADPRKIVNTPPPLQREKGHRESDAATTS